LYQKALHISDVTNNAMRYEQNKNVDFITSTIIFAIIFELVILIPIEQKAAAVVPITAISPYKSGYAQGCPDGQNGNHGYLDTSGGPSAHSNAFMRGYSDGYSFCSNSARDGDSGSSNSPRTR
jgi:hypothetical protein